jgi:hypothetical protein
MMSLSLETLFNFINLSNYLVTLTMENIGQDAPIHWLLIEITSGTIPQLAVKCSSTL